MRRTLAALAAGVVLAGVAPALAATGGTAEPADAATGPPDDRAVLHPVVADQAKAAPAERLTVLVHAHELTAARAAAEAAGLQVVSDYPSVGVVAATGSAAAAADVARRPGVTYVEPDAPLQWFLDTAHEATGVNDARDPAFGLLRPDGTPYDGSGVTIAINDSGVDGTHPMFERADGSSKVVRNVRAVATPGLTVNVAEVDTDDSDVANGHGTHVAGIAAGFERTTDDGRVVRGVAPGADLVAYGSGAGLHIAAAADGLQWVLKHHADPCGDGSCPPIKVVNNSWGTTGEYDPESLIGKLSDALVAAGVVVIFAVGNGDSTGDGGDGSRNLVNPYAQNPTPGVIGVANYDDGGTGSRDGSLAPSSSRGERARPETYPDISAPGTMIVSACTYTMPICRSYGDVSDPHYAAISGTSMAAPYVAGAAAILLEADPTLTPAQVEDLLEDHAHPFTAGALYEPDPANDDHHTSFDKGHGLLELVGSLGEALGGDVPNTTSPFAGCLEGGAFILDGTEDATDTSTDLTSVDLSWDAVAEQLTFTISVADLTESYPEAANGYFHRVEFKWQGDRYYVSSSREIVNNTPPEVNGESFDFGRREGRRFNALAAIPGAFDFEADTITLTLTQQAIETANEELGLLGGTLEPMTDGQVLSAFEAGGHRSLTAVAVSALWEDDVAPGSCSYEIGVGPVA